MTKMIPIVITILSCRGKYLFIQRRNPPYEGLWSMVGGKVNIGEHIHEAAIREVREETGTNEVVEYDYRGIVSERLIDTNKTLLSHFIIFVGHASINDFNEDHREGELALFALDEIEAIKEQFLPSDYEMFYRFLSTSMESSVHEVELLRDDKGYHLVYYRVP
ncbi:NUDIX domain-containing protein [Candidatus Thorarchaeota archaeon]|nr:MAG: NUDIX domain-containing protein [Candidatus Thorarchaeota archaeon]